MNIKAMEAKIEERVTERLTTQLQSKGDEDDEMTGEGHRIKELENRLTQIESTMHEQHQAQLVQNQTMTKQIQHVQSQSEGLRQHFDQKMDEQLSHIEMLLTGKKHKGAE